ncbi:MAG: PucR family transcriptional regulator, partial [Actinomycetota bacterium]
VLVLPETPFDEIVNPLLTAIAGHQLEALHRSMAVHDELTRAALREEGDPSSVAQILTEALARPAAIFSDRGELLAFAGGDAGGDHVAPSAGTTRGGIVHTNGSSYYVASAPAGGTPRAVVAVKDVDPDDTFGRSAITHAAVVAGMLVVGRQQVEEVYRRYERELFEDLTEGRTLEPEDARSRASRIGWPLHRPYLVMAIGRERNGRSNGDAAAEPGAFGEGDLTKLGSALEDSGIEARLFLRPPGAGVVVHFRSSDNPAGVVDRIAGLLGAIDPPWNHDDVVVGVGRPRRDVAAVAGAFAEAKLAFRFHRQVHPLDRRVTHFSDLGPIGLLSLSTNPAHILKVARTILGPLASPALSRRDDLLVTIRTVLARNMNLRVAADELFFHYNTVRHRMSRLRSLLGDALDDPERRLLLSLAVTTLELYEGPVEASVTP